MREDLRLASESEEAYENKTLRSMATTITPVAPATNPDAAADPSSDPESQHGAANPDAANPEAASNHGASNPDAASNHGASHH